MHDLTDAEREAMREFRDRRLLKSAYEWFVENGVEDTGEWDLDEDKRSFALATLLSQVPIDDEPIVITAFMVALNDFGMDIDEFAPVSNGSIVAQLAYQAGHVMGFMLAYDDDDKAMHDTGMDKARKSFTKFELPQ